MELQIRNLSKRYRNGVQAIDNLTLSIPSGMFGLLGPNGAGKSTLMRILATLQEADSGSIEMDGIDVLKERDKVRELLGYLPQEFGLYPKAVAYDLLDHFAYLKGYVKPFRRRVMLENLLRRTNLWDVRHRKLGTYSGGMKQRFGVAQALIGDPRLLIVDEPTAGLDPEERVRFLNLLSDVGQEVIVILSTHIVADVSYLCRSLAILHHGKLMGAGDPAELVSVLGGRVWQASPTREDLTRYQQTLPVISWRLAAGHPQVRVWGETSPGPGFQPVEPELEDAYFWHVSPPVMPETAALAAPSC